MTPSVGGFRLAGAGLVAALCAAAAIAPPAAPSAPPEVTLIGDSIATPILWYPRPREILGDGLDLRVEVAVCRALAGQSCPDNGVRPPTLVALVPTLGSELGPTVVLVMGENDPEASLPDDAETAIQTLLDAGVKRILWTNLRAVRPQFGRMDGALAAVAAKHPEVTILDWNAYSGNHPEWFQSDGLHLTEAGGEKLAAFLHDGVMQALFAPTPILVAPARLPPARVGRAYAVHLLARDGTAPYHWRVTSGPLPAGLHLAAAGLLEGRPRRAERLQVVLEVSDTRGVTASRRLLLTIAAR
jgi:hypothetical protein